ncbi:MAG TPA: hypothetical protein VFH72_06015 [Candidatus Baltobacteraceae bacterium]|jgi:hypothetical protein|nr:hypothetical protein [Candidatus Baltobacteraceae bacterium]
MRYFAAIVAFAVATAFAARAQLLPEFLVQLRDPNLLGGPLLAFALKSSGYAFVLAICAVLSGGAVLLSAWRTRLRGASDTYAALAAVLATLCLTGRFGVTLDPIGWICAAGFALLLERKGRAATMTALALVAIWSLLQGGAPLAALLAVLAFAGAWIDARSFDRGVREKAVLAGGSILLGTLQLHALPWHAYGAHALYLDSLLAGAQRDHLWNGGITVNGLAFCAILITGGWYGVRRRERSGDAFTFFALMLLAMIDVRNLPYFGLLAAPIVADAAASYYVGERTVPGGSFIGYAAAFCACAFTFVATMIGTEPKAVFWPQAAEQPAHLLVVLAAERGEHRILCEQPRWCDGTREIFQHMRPLLDDRAGWAGATALRTQEDAVSTHGAWRSELAHEHVNAIIAKRDANIVSLLTQTGWRLEGRDGARVLIVPGGTQ